MARLKPYVLKCLSEGAVGLHGVCRVSVWVPQAHVCAVKCSMCVLKKLWLCVEQNREGVSKSEEHAKLEPPKTAATEVTLVTEHT